MNELIINYGYSKSQKILPLLAGGYFALYGFYQCVVLALNNSYTFNFYIALAGIILGIILILSVTLWKQLPLFKMNSESIYINMPDVKSVYTANWIDIKEVGIGISYFKFTETDGKIYNIDISGLKYNDLKHVKSEIVEICESKNIPYRND